MQILVNSQKISLTKNNFLSSGGEGNVHVKDNFAYKIYHDPKKCIPEAKVLELSKLDRSEILAPKFPVKNENGKNIGFAMPYVSDTEYLVKLFNKGYRNKNNITPETIKNLVEYLRELLIFIHSKEVLVVDYNPLNFLVSKDYKKPFHIDVDSYKTKSYPATAIMESIRDPKTISNTFSKNSDWFSWGVVCFELYMGCHPFKGRHPDYNIKDWLQMLKNGVSVFNKKSKLPPATQDWSVVPKAHLKWFESVFEHGERKSPPAADYIEITTGKIKPKIISGNESFKLELLQEFNSEIKKVAYDFGNQYVLTKESFYCNGKKYNLALNSNTNIKRDFLFLNNEPYIVELDKTQAKISIFNVSKSKTCEISAKDFFVYDDKIFIPKAGSLYEIQLSSLQKLIPLNQQRANLFWNHELFDGCVIEYWPFDDGKKIYNTVNIIYPSKTGCRKIQLKELAGLKIFEVKYTNDFAVLIVEKSGNYFRAVFCFNIDGTYSYRSEKVDLEDFDFTVLEKGVCVAKNSQNLEIFLDNSKVRVLKSPLNSDDLLFSDKNQTLVACHNKLYKLNNK